MTAPGGEGGRARAAAIVACYDATLAFFCSRLGPREQDAAEDLAHDTVVAALVVAARNGDLDMKNPVPYVLGIARNKLADFLRRKYRRRELPLDEGVPESALRDLADRGHTLRMILAEQRRRVAEAIALLSETERQILTMLMAEGATVSEVASAVGLPAPEVSRIKYRALEKIRAGLGRGSSR